MKALEQQLFEWENWEQIDTASFMFLGIKLNVAIGNFPVGTEFEWALFDIEKSQLTLGNDAECDCDNCSCRDEFKFDLIIKAV